MAQDKAERGVKENGLQGVGQSVQQQFVRHVCVNHQQSTLPIIKAIGSIARDG